MIGRILIIFALGAQFCANAQLNFRGVVKSADSTEILAFAYIVSKHTGSGTMSDHEGRFTITIAENDTLICSYVGYSKGSFPVKQLQMGVDAKIVLYMTPLPIQLNAITVSVFKIKPYEREYMNDIIERSKIKNLETAQSPITALYMRYSKEGKQITKLARIFEQIMMEEQVQRKLNRDILVKLTGDENIDYIAFRKYCYYVNDYFIATHDGEELYSRVMECYRNYKNEGRDQPLRKRETAVPRTQEQ